MNLKVLGTKDTPLMVLNQPGYSSKDQATSSLLLTGKGLFSGIARALGHKPATRGDLWVGFRLHYFYYYIPKVRGFPFHSRMYARGLLGLKKLFRRALTVI